MGILEKLFGPPNIEKLKEKGDVDGLIKALSHALSHKDWAISAKAAEALGDLSDPLAVEPLITALNYDDRVAPRAAEALGKIGDARTVEPLAVALKRASTVRKAAALALANIGNVAVEPLIAALSDRSYDVRKAAATALQSLNWQPADDSQRALLAVAREDWEGAAAIGQAALPALLEEKMYTRDSRLQEAVSQAIAAIGLSDLQAVAGTSKPKSIQHKSAWILMCSLAAQRDPGVLIPLAAVAVTNGWKAYDAVGMVESILRGSAEAASEFALRTIARLACHGHIPYPDGEGFREGSINCTAANQLARKELERRGCQI